MYKYKCPQCNTTTTVLQKHGDPPPQHCGKTMTKIPAANRFHLKGKGWYRDGYRS